MPIYQSKFILFNVSNEDEFLDTSKPNDNERAANLPVNIRHYFIVNWTTQVH
jgi:hypothetical protein